MGMRKRRDIKYIKKEKKIRELTQLYTVYTLYFILGTITIKMRLASRAVNAAAAPVKKDGDKNQGR